MRGAPGGAGLLDYTVLIVAVVNVSTASILVRLAGVHGFVAASWRLLLGSMLTMALLALLYFLGRHRRPVMPSKGDLLLAAVSGAALALHFGLWMVSLFHLNVALSVTIVDSYPALIAVIGRLFFGERYTSRQLMGAALAMLGVASLSLYSGYEGLGPPGGNPLLGSLLALGGMIAVSVYFSIGKKLREKYTTLEYTLLVYSIASVTSIALTVYVVREEMTGYEAETYVYLMLLALLPMLGGHSLINYALRKLTLLAATIPILGEPVGAAILAWIVLGEPIGLAEASLMAITLSGIALVLLGEASGKGKAG